MSMEGRHSSPRPLLAGLSPEMLFGQGLAGKRDEQSPQDLPGLEMIRLLGRGGMGEVYLARQTSLDREVAVKFVDEGRIGSALERFEREARTMAKLRHPNLVIIHHFESMPEGRAAIVMEHVEGGNLREWMLLHPGPRPVAEALPMIRGIGAGLAAAHKAGIVHRDMKPENVLIGGDGGPRVGDFGLALPVEPGSTRLTVGGAVVGTIDYMAPERFDSSDADARGDIYAVGVILYELLTGKLPRGHFDPPKRLRPDLPRSLSEAVMRALRAEPQERFATMREFLAALDRVEARGITRRWFLPVAGLAGAGVAAGLWSKRGPAGEKGAEASPPLLPKEGWQGLIAGADVSVETISGGWQKEGSRLLSDEGICILALAETMPESYRLRVVFTRLSGEHSIAVFFRSKDGTGSVDIDGWDQHLAGVQNVDWQDLRHTGGFSFEIENGRSYELVVGISPELIRIWIDGKERIATDIRGKHLEVVFPWAWNPAQRPAALAIGSYQSPTRFSEIGWVATEP